MSQAGKYGKYVKNVKNVNSTKKNRNYTKGTQYSTAGEKTHVGKRTKTGSFRRRRSAMPGILAAIAIGLVLLVWSTPAEKESMDFSGEGMTITLLDVGQGLAVWIEADGQSLLYDGGGRESSSYVVSYLNQHGCRKLDYMIASHYDADHIAGLVGCLYHYPVTNLLCPDYKAETKIYSSFVKAAKESGAKTVTPEAGEEYALGCGSIRILAAPAYDGENENNASIVVQIVYGDFRCLLTGDAEWAEEKSILDAGSDVDSAVYVAGHHGSYGSSEYSFVEAIGPKAALISCGEGNEYGHPSERTMNVLEDSGAAIYRTDKQGTIICTTDGRSFSMNTEPCRDHSPGKR